MMNGSSPNSMNAPRPLPSPNSQRQEISRKYSSNRFAAMEKPNPIPNPDPNPNPGHYDMPKTQQIAVPTTFVQADTNSFRELVQKLTGISDDTQEKLPITMPARHSSRPTAGSATSKQVSDGGVAVIGLGSKSGGIEVGPRRSSFKLQERRQNMRKLEIKLGLTSLRHTQHPGNALSPSPRGEIRSIDLPALVPSPVTPLGSDPFSYTPTTTPNSSNAAVVSLIYGSPTPTAESVSDEERAIAEKGFYLHPSPLNTPRGSEPELLPLFPLHSPRQSTS